MSPVFAAGRGGRRLLIALVILAGIGLLIGSGLQDTLTYYRTPGELLSDPPPPGQRIRLGGQVVPDTVQVGSREISFELADSHGHEVRVVHTGSAPPDSFQEGEGAVVEGVLGGNGVFHSDTLIVKHSNEYRPPSGDDSGTSS